MPRQTHSKTDNALLEMALVGYQSRIDELDAKIGAIRAQLGHRGPGRPKLVDAAAPNPGGGTKRTMSPAARARIAAAQKARWAAYRKGSSSGATSKAATAKPKRKLSAAGRQAIIDATKRRWAAAKAAQAVSAQA